MGEVERVVKGASLESSIEERGLVWRKGVRDEVEFVPLETELS
jgi:hypothetical protein